MGGPGVQRSIQLVKNLRGMGYEPHVITIKNEEVKRLSKLIDESLLDSLPKGTEITRLDSGVPFKLIAFLQKLKIYRLFWFFLYPFFWEQSALWPRRSFNKVMKLINEGNFDLLYTTSGPFSSIKLGAKIQRSSGLKWVADLRDPFTDAYAWQFPSKLHWKKMRRFEKKYFSKPDKLIVNTPEVKKLYLKRKLTSANKIKVITNGFG